MTRQMTSLSVIAPSPVRKFARLLICYDDGTAFKRLLSPNRVFAMGNRIAALLVRTGHFTLFPSATHTPGYTLVRNT